MPRDTETPIQPVPGSYEPPNLTYLGRVQDVVLGVAGGGDDHMGYSLPDFEFMPDGDGPTGADTTPD
jgi:hypothetical protein